MLEAYPGDHAGGEGLSGRAFQAFTVEAVGDFVVIAVLSQVPDAGDEGGRIAHRLGAALRQAKLKGFGGAALPPDLQLQLFRLWPFGDGDVFDK